MYEEITIGSDCEKEVSKIALSSCLNAIVAGLIAWLDMSVCLFFLSVCVSVVNSYVEDQGSSVNSYEELQTVGHHGKPFAIYLQPVYVVPFDSMSVSV